MVTGVNAPLSQGKDLKNSDKAKFDEQSKLIFKWPFSKLVIRFLRVLLCLSTVRGSFGAQDLLYSFNHDNPKI